MLVNDNTEIFTQFKRKIQHEEEINYRETCWGKKQKTDDITKQVSACETMPTPFRHAGQNDSEKNKIGLNTKTF